jgi:hypothetical protein
MSGADRQRAMRIWIADAARIATAQAAARTMRVRVLTIPIMARSPAEARTCDAVSGGDTTERVADATAWRLVSTPARMGVLTRAH